MGEGALGVVTSHHYAAAHPSAMNKKFVEAFGKANKACAQLHGLGGYDGMRVIYEALKSQGCGWWDALLAAMKGQIFESRGGPSSLMHKRVTWCRTSICARLKNSMATSQRGI